MKYSFLSEDESGVVVNVRVSPRAKRSVLKGEHDGELKIRVAAPAVDNKANKELIRFLATFFGVSKRKVGLIRGEHSRSKTLSLAGMTLKEAASRLDLSASDA